MNPCPRCGHENLPSFPTCSKCHAPLSPTARHPDEAYASLLADRAGNGRRNRAVYGLVAAIVLGAIGFKMVQDRNRKAAAADKLAFLDRWVALDKRETGAFWSCVLAGDVDVGMLTTANQVQSRVESAYATQPRTFASHLTEECVPRLEEARRAFAAIVDAPEEFRGPLQSYNASLPPLQSGLESYAERIKSRPMGKDVDTLIQDLGGAWHANSSPTPEGIAFEKFMQCAIPGLSQMKDAQAMLEFLADACFKKDAAAFMRHVHDACGALLTTDNKAAPSRTWKISQRFYEQDARQLQAWESCSRKARKGQKADDLTPFLTATGSYMHARADMAQAARDLAAAVR